MDNLELYRLARFTRPDYSSDGSLQASLFLALLALALLL